MQCLVRFVIPLLILSTIYSAAQLNDRTLSRLQSEWEVAGYHGGDRNNIPQTYQFTIKVPRPQQSAQEDTRALLSALERARKLPGRKLVLLDKGTYYLEKPLRFSPKYNYITIRGSGTKKSIIKYIGDASSQNNIFQVVGQPDRAQKIKISRYDSLTNTITWDGNFNPPNNSDTLYLELRFPNGWWHSTRSDNKWAPEDYLGQFGAATTPEEKELKLIDDLSLLWSIAKPHAARPYFTPVVPIKEVGIENLTLISDTNNNGIGNNISFEYAYNCWVRGVESVNVPRMHVYIGRSSRISILDSYLHHAQSYGGGGSGYGVRIAYYATYCLVEHNAFEHLRHAMMVQAGANRNVFGYNYSKDQFNEGNLKLSDINIHGYFPLGNLFESNIVEKIHADSYWGLNGPFNTFFRNFVTTREIMIEKANLTNVVGNFGELYTKQSEKVIDIFGIEETNQDQSFSVSEKIRPHHSTSSFLPIVSLYKKGKPSFLPNNVAWPIIGPGVRQGEQREMPNLKVFINTFMTKE